MDGSLLNTISLSSIFSGNAQYNGSVSHLSQFAFNLDPKLEFVVSRHLQTSTGSNVAAFIVNEDGLILDTIDEVSFGNDGFQTTATGLLRIIGYESQSNKNPFQKITFFSLPGYYDASKPCFFERSEDETIQPQEQLIPVGTVLLHPNPVETEFSIELPDQQVIPQGASIRVFTPEARSILKMVNPNESKQLKMDVKLLDTGTYMYRLSHQDSKILAAGRFMKK